MVIGEVPSRTCRYCDDEPCEWVQYSRDITGSRLRMLTCSHRRLTSRLVTRTLSQHYYYKKYGQLSKKTRIRLPFLCGTRNPAARQRCQPCVYGWITTRGGTNGIQC